MEDSERVLVNQEELNQEKLFRVAEGVQLEESEWVLVSREERNQENLFRVVEEV